MTIVVEDLVVDRGDTRAVDGVSFRVEPGSVTALLGPNGAGKTTLLETLQGFHRPTSGQVRMLGLDPQTARRELSTRWGVMPQQGGFPMGTTVAETVTLFARLQASSQPVEEILAATGLDSLAGRRWKQLSGGEQQRLNLAIALCGGNEVLLVDEPTAAVDAAGRESILTLLTQRAAAGAAVLVTTHRFDDVERIADRVVIIHHGHSQASGTIDQLTSADDRIEFRSTPGLPVVGLTTRLATDPALARPGSSFSGSVTENPPGHYRVDAPPRAELVAAIGSWLADRSLVPETMLAGRRSLESVFLELTDDGTVSTTGSPDVR